MVSLLNIDNQRTNSNHKVGTIESVLSGVASGLIAIPKGFFSLGATLMDLGVNSGKAASVEQFFDDINPFDDEAEARTIGKITTALTQIAPLGVFGAIRGAAAAPKISEAANNLAKKMLKAKQDGKYFGALDFGRKALAGGAKFVGKENVAKTAGAVVGFKDYANTFDTNNLTIGRNSSNIVNAASDLVVNTQGAGLELVYSGDATTGWTYREK